MKIEKKILFRVSLMILFDILFVIVIRESANIYGEFLWFKMLKYPTVFWTIFFAKVFPALLFGMGFTLLAGLNIYLARKMGPKKTLWEMSYRTSDLNRVQVIPIEAERVNKFLILICFVLGIFMGIWPAILKWDEFLRFWYQTPFSQVDPIFHRDIGFFVFSYPVYLFIQKWLFYALIIISLLVGYIYKKDKAMNLKWGEFMFTKRAKVHLSVLTGFILLLIAWNNRLKTLGLLYSSRGAVFGAGYTDINAQLIAYWIFIVIAAVCAFLFWFNTSAEGWKWPLIGLVTLCAISIFGNELYPWIFQKFIVEPNELTREKPYILHNIHYTRLGYNLDQTEEKDFRASTNLSPEDLQKNSLTLKNVKLWDKDPLKQTYSELQEMRLYYKFVSVDEDRYTLNGEKTQIMLSARELDQSKLPSQAQTFENKCFKYTHGYGLCMSPVNNVTEKGLPNLVIKDIPPVSQTTLDVTRPEIYYGETDNDFVIVKTKSQEFDYPRGDINVYSQYHGNGGVPISSFFNRLVFSIKYLEPKILFTDYITKKSRIMLHRQIRDRVRTLAPFLTYDRDPYLVVSDEGRLFWIQDAYTTTDKYPYSERTKLFPDSYASYQTQSEIFAGQKISPKKINYIRNSVKIVIDAYNGTTIYYVMDETDPIIRTYQKIFPGLFKSLTGMPEDLRHHIRYPRDMFEIQANMYRLYHMRDAQVFYNREDLWDLPMQKGSSGQAGSPMNGYYMTMRLPNQKEEKFSLMVPFTPDNKNNTIAWMCAQCDGPDYGKLMIYKFPKEKLIYGPRQIEARIDQQTDISSKLSLWSQQGSDVFRGDLLVIPIEESILYIEPVFLIANDKSNVPELKRVIVAYGEKIEMEPTLAAALQKIFFKKPSKTPPLTLAQSVDQAKTGEQSITDLAKMVIHYFQSSMGSFKKGDWVEYGKYQEELQKIIQDMSVVLEENDKINHPSQALIGHYPDDRISR